VIAEGEALGFGDVTLSGVIGLLLGWPGVIAGLIVAVFLAGAVGLLAMLPMLFRRQYDPNLALPYGPFLALGAFYLLYLRP
jgi:leader peptidase (prepilin peptidase)/N-methyltransferase